MKVVINNDCEIFTHSIRFGIKDEYVCAVTAQTC